MKVLNEAVGGVEEGRRMSQMLNLEARNLLATWCL